VARQKKGLSTGLFYRFIFNYVYLWAVRFPLCAGCNIARLHDLLSLPVYILPGGEFTITAIAGILTIDGLQRETTYGNP